MAKGNDGNYLQHCIEVEAAVRLAEMDAAGRLHIALTHGMRPFEPFERYIKGTSIQTNGVSRLAVTIPWRMPRQTSICHILANNHKPDQGLQE